MQQKIDFRSFKSGALIDLLELKPPPFAQNPFHQLQYIQDYVEVLGCVTIIIEGHYIDRDHIEDHSAFYSRNFYSYENSCRRLHFFSIEEDALKRELTLLVETGKKGQIAYREACEKFSDAWYLGSSVIKPLEGCPVGRTILRTYPSKGKDYQREFPSVRRHRAHLLGVELSVHGIPFQQQDTGVSACATTAIWSALHHFRGDEDVAAATPAQITNLASRYSLPFGRSMPSEGLSMEQMCQAMQGLGVSPHLYRTGDFDTAQSIIYSATMSRMSAVLIIERNLERGGKKVTERHAVTVTGIKIAQELAPTNGVVDRSRYLLGAYVHDDRWGPYVSILFENDGGRGSLRFLARGVIKDEEKWAVTHILIPTHAKINFSFSGLQEAAMEIAVQVQWFFVTHLKLAEPDIQFRTSIVRSYKYVEELLFDNNGLESENAIKFSGNVSLPRYIALVRLENPLIGIIDVVLDTTGTLRNLNCWAVVSRDSKGQHAAAVGEFLVKQFEAYPTFFGIPEVNAKSLKL